MILVLPVLRVRRIDLPDTFVTVVEQATTSQHRIDMHCTRAVAANRWESDIIYSAFCDRIGVPVSSVLLRYWFAGATRKFDLEKLQQGNTGPLGIA